LPKDKLLENPLLSNLKITRSLFYEEQGAFDADNASILGPPNLFC
jgi:hypothetical protein